MVSRSLGTNLMSLVLASISLLSMIQVCFYLEFDLTLGVIPNEYVASSCSTYFYMLYSVLLTSRKLIGP
jgi:hypothetical protein